MTVVRWHTLITSTLNTTSKPQIPSLSQTVETSWSRVNLLLLCHRYHLWKHQRSYLLWQLLLIVLYLSNVCGPVQPITELMFHTAVCWAEVYFLLQMASRPCLHLLHLPRHARRERHSHKTCLPWDKTVGREEASPCSGRWLEMGGLSARYQREWVSGSSHLSHTKLTCSHKCSWFLFFCWVICCFHRFTFWW